MKLLYFFIFILTISIKGQFYITRDSNYAGGPSGWETFPYLFTPNGTALVSNAGEGKLKKKLLDGSYDPNFGINGSIPVSPTYGDKMDCVANDQNIYTFWRLPSPSIGWTIKKYDSNGVLDSSYGVNGTLTINYNYYQVFTDNNSNLYFVDLNNKIKKILANGQVDNSFNFNNPTSIVGLSNNYLYIYKSLGVSRIDFNGNLDTTFGNQGGLSLGKFYLNENTDEIITFTISSTSTSTMIIEKYTSTGVIDTNFGVNGVKTITAFTTPMFYTADFDSDGNIVFFGGYPLSNWTVGSYPNLKMIMRLKPNGMEDYTFNHNSFYYMGNTDNDGYIIDAKIVNGNKYLVINKYRYTMGSFKTYLSQIIRTAVLSTSEIGKEGKLSVYPNPVQDQINIVLNDNEKLESIEIFDMTGRSIKKAFVLKNDVTDLAKGTYLLRIKTDKKSYQTKFIKS